VVIRNGRQVPIMSITVLIVKGVWDQGPTIAILACIQVKLRGFGGVWYWNKLELGRWSSGNSHEVKVSVGAYIGVGARR
jgi:hypothetical protein